MADSVYKIVELTGTSTTTMEDAVNNALAKASKTIRNMSWFELIETRGRIANDKVEQWQVTVKVGFQVDE